MILSAGLFSALGLLGGNTDSRGAVRRGGLRLLCAGGSREAGAGSRRICRRTGLVRRGAGLRGAVTGLLDLDQGIPRWAC
jgi:hypothetical protein